MQRRESFEMLDVRTYAVRHACRDAFSCRSFVFVEQQHIDDPGVDPLIPAALAARPNATRVRNAGEPRGRGRRQGRGHGHRRPGKKDIKLGRSPRQR